MQLNKLAFSASAFLLMSGASGLSHALAVPPNFSIAGIPPPGFEHFDNTAKITLIKTGTGPTATFQMTAVWVSSTFLLQADPSNAFNVNSGTYQVVANFNSVGTFVPAGSSVTVTGSVPTYTGPGVGIPTGTLYSANLVGFGADTIIDATPTALGFKTDNATGWAAQFQTDPESVYLYGFNVASFMSSFTSNKFKSVIYNNALAYTTVPVPAAAWLFGSALVGLSGWRRRNSVSSCEK